MRCVDTLNSLKILKSYYLNEETEERRSVMKINFINFEDYYDEEHEVSNHKAVENKGDFTDDGIFSQRIFGKIQTDGIYSNKYSCECGELTGKYYNGYTCPQCKTEVKITDLENRIGWINFEPYYFINPVFYYFIERIISDINKILDYKLTIDIDGEIVESENAYHNLGLIEFKERFVEILDDYFSLLAPRRKTTYRKFYDILIKNLEKVFINKLPVYNVGLRPAIMKGNNLIFDKINNFYNKILYNIKIVKKKSEIKDSFLLPLLYVIQQNLQKIFLYTVDNISGKSGLLRNNLLGCRVNFSMRSIIIPADPGQRLDEIVIPYIGFMELYKFQVINMISKIKDVNINTASKIWNKALVKRDKIVDEIIENLIAKGNLSVLLNRNPTISFGSILYMKVIGVNEEINDYTMSIHNNILRLLAADYDGDCLNVIMIADESLKRTFESLNPINMLIDFNTGDLAGNMVIDDDAILGVYSLCNYGEK